MWRQRGNCTSRGLAYNKFVGGRVRICVCARGRVRACERVGRCALAGVHVNGCSHVRTGVRGVWFCASARHACAAGCVFRERPCVCCRRTLMSLSWSSSVCAAVGRQDVVAVGAGASAHTANSSTHVQPMTPTPAPPRSTRAPVTCATSGTLWGAFWARVSFVVR